MSRGLFITFEGGEGAGKSTQCRLLAEALTAQGHTCLLTREPGGSPGAEQIRSLLVQGDKDRWDTMTEMLLFMAARRNHLTQTIWPALQAGKVVICDRFLDSTVAYQGYGYGKNQKTIDDIYRVYHLIAGDFKPDLTFILDLDPADGIRRSLSRTGNTEQRFESMDLTFHQNLRTGFLELAKNNDRYYVIDALQSIDIIHREITDIVRQKGS